MIGQPRTLGHRAIVAETLKPPKKKPGQYLTPLGKRSCACVEDQSQIQVLDRTVPGVADAAWPDRARSHDHYRYGTTILFTALDIATGEVTATLKHRYRNTVFLCSCVPVFLKQIERTYRDVVDQATGERVELRQVMDNYAAHKRSAVKAWLAVHPRFTVRFTPPTPSR